MRLYQLEAGDLFTFKNPPSNYYKGYWFVADEEEQARSGWMTIGTTEHVGLFQVEADIRKNGLHHEEVSLID